MSLNWIIPPYDWLNVLTSQFLYDEDNDGILCVVEYIHPSGELISWFCVWEQL